MLPVTYLVWPLSSPGTDRYGCVKAPRRFPPRRRSDALSNISSSVGVSQLGAMDHMDHLVTIRPTQRTPCGSYRPSVAVSE